MSFRVAWSAGVLALILGGCALLEDEPSAASIEELFGMGAPPVEVSDIDLGPFALEGETTFCEAAARAPLRWTTDALLPMRFWVDSFASASEISEDAGPAIDQLLEFTRARLTWSPGGGGDRPMWDEVMDAAAMTFADAAIRSCPDLPLSIGPEGMSDTPIGWDGLDAGEIAAQSASSQARVERGIEEFQTTYGRAPTTPDRDGADAPVFRDL